MAELTLDESKILYHQERLADWFNGNPISPITIDMALTQACNFNCIYCYAQAFQERKGHKITWKIAERFLDDCAEMGVKAISLVSDGESTVNPIYADFIVYGHKLGIDMALGTNGYLLDYKTLKKIMPCLTYLRFNISAGTEDRFAYIHGTKKESFHRVSRNIHDAVSIKHEGDYACTIGLQMVLMPDNGEDIIPLAKLGKHLDVNYLVIKHTSDDENGGLGIDYSKYKDLYNLLKEAENESTDFYKVVVKWNKIEAGNVRSYKQCYATNFHLQISGSGLVAPCGMFFNDKYKKYHIGDFTQTRFKDIVKSDRFEDVMIMLESENFDAQKDCGVLCLQDLSNKVLDKIVKTKKIPPKPEKDIMHVNFI